jgi:polyketide biosynthesis 3-hydroxy-3-methylglutaryl-CoA synthase-like enzyme PksG
MNAIGIEKLNIYGGVAAIEVAEIFRGRGLDPSRMDNIQQTRRSIGLGFEDPVTNAVAAAKPIVDALGDEAERIEVLITSSESGVDYSKSIASYVHKYLGLSRHCRILEVKQACYAATGALQLAVGYLCSGLSPGAKVLVIATDIALVDARAEYAEPATGFGAAAILLGESASVLQIDRGAFGMYSYETMDSARPTPSADIADVDRSLFAYLDCFTNSFADYRSRVSGTDFLSTFGQLCLHTPFAGLVRAAHRKALREAGVSSAEAIADDFSRRVGPSLVYPKEVGNLCSGSLYLALASLIENRPDNDQTRVGLFSYGSGCSSEFFSGVIDAGSRDALRPFALREQLAQRTILSFSQYADLLKANLAMIVPVQDREVPFEPYEQLLPKTRRPMLALRRISGYHRQYEWV